MRLALIICCWLAQQLAAQSNEQHILFQAQIGWQNALAIEAGAAYQWQFYNTSRSSSSGDFIRPIRFPNAALAVGAQFGAYYQKNQPHWRFAPQLIAEYCDMNISLLGPMARLRTIAYLPNNQNDISLAICPEIGLHLFTLVSLSYGYQFAWGAQPLDMGPHRVSLNFSVSIVDMEDFRWRKSVDKILKDVL